MRIFILILFLVAFNAASGQDAKEVFDKSVDAVGLITDGTGCGSGFFIKKNMFITNYHVINGLDNGRAYIRLNSGTTIHIREIVGLNKDKDLAIVETESDNNSILPLSDGKKINKGEKVYAIGNPSAGNTVYEFNITEGIINNITTNEYKTDAGNIFAEVILHSASLNPGNSGGPLLTKDAAVVGINSFYYSQGNNMYFAIHVDELIKFLNSKNITYKNLDDRANDSRSKNGNSGKSDEDDNIILYLIIAIIVVIAATAFTAFFYNNRNKKHSLSSEYKPERNNIEYNNSIEEVPIKVYHEENEITGRLIYQGRNYIISKSDFYAGRDDINDLKLLDQSASRRHFLIKFDGINYYISDLNSKNGTKVNNSKISVSLLRDRDRIQAGASEIIFLKT